MKTNTPQQSINILIKKHDLQIKGHTIIILRNKIRDRQGNLINNPKKHNDLGNKSWGRIDSLINHHNFNLIYVSKFKQKRQQ